MSHPFEVGKTYRNRVGEYVVQEIEGDRMKIRYVSGGTLETSASIQARIWENIQFEEQMAREQERLRLAREARLTARKRTARAKRARAKPKFAGFQESDFAVKKRGIAWSSRKELGKVLAHELKQRTKADYDQWIVPRRSRVHVAQKEYYDRETGERNAAFFVAADDEGVTYGFRVGKSSGKAKANWPWSVLLAALADEDKVRRDVRALMKEHELGLDVYAMDVNYGQVGQVTRQTRDFLWQHETEDQEVTKRMNWQALIDYLQSVAPNERCALYLCKHVPAADALKAGAGIASEITAVLEALVPIYDVSVGA
jgi:hypothetical protein